MKATYSSKTGQLSSGQNKIILTKQLKICLEFFIKNEGNVVTKDDIFQECWGSRGIIVSDSTLRQSLYKLRKAFSDIGVEQEILVNHSRNNYYLVTGILELTQEEDVNPEGADEQSEPSSQSETNLQPETSSQFDHHAVSSSKPHATIMNREVPFYKLCALITTCILFFLCGMVLRSTAFKNTITYLPYAAVHGRHYYFTHGFPADKSQAIWRAGYWLDYQMVTVHASRFVYINSARQNLMSIMICNDKIEDLKSKCESFVVIGEKVK